MERANSNPRLSSVLKVITLIELLVLLAVSVGLLFAPAVARPLWPWEVAPFNARFLGAVYMSALMAVAALAFRTYWSPGRLVLVMLFTFTAYVLIITVLYLDQFDFGKWSTWAWFALYIILPLNAAIHLWMHRRQPPADSRPLTPAGRTLLMVQGILLAVYTLALIIIPVAAAAFWPWGIDAFHARMYAAMFFGAAVGSLVAMRGASAAELLALGLGEAAFGLFAILGLILVDAEVRRVDWSLPGTWLWLAIFALMVVGGGILVTLSRRRTP